MRGFTKNKYKRIMDKLYIDRPMHKVDMFVRTTTQPPHNQVHITNIPCMVNIISSDTQYEPVSAIYYIIKKIEIVIESKYLANKKLTNGADLLIPLTLANSQNGGYNSTNLSINLDNTDSSKLGYYGAYQINYGEYIDGGYGEYIKYVIIKKEVIV